MMLFVPKLSGPESYITMLFTQMLPEYVFNNFFPRMKVIMVFIPKLPSPGVYIIMLFTKKLSVVYF